MLVNDMMICSWSRKEVTATKFHNYQILRISRVLDHHLRSPCTSFMMSQRISTKEFSFLVIKPLRNSKGHMQTPGENYLEDLIVIVRVVK